MTLRLREKLFGATPEKEWLHLIGYLEPPVSPNSQLSGATGWLQKTNYMEPPFPKSQLNGATNKQIC